MKRICLLIIIGLIGTVSFAQTPTQTKPQEQTPELKSQNKTQTVPQTKTIPQSTNKPVRTEVKQLELIKPISDNINSEYPGYKIEQSFKHELNGVISYSVIISKDLLKREIIYNAEGEQKYNRELFSEPQPQKLKLAPPPDTTKGKRIN